MLQKRNAIDVVLLVLKHQSVMLRTSTLLKGISCVDVYIISAFFLRDELLVSDFFLHGEHLATNVGTFVNRLV